MSNGISGIDHLIIAVRDLEAARKTYARLGFTATPRGRHVDMATGNYCLMFETDYLELMGIVDPSLPDRGLMARMAERGEGLSRTAFAVTDVDATAAALGAAGYEIDGPLDLMRTLELPEGTVEPRFKLILLPDGAAPVMNGFICHHETPELVRRPEWLRHPNGARAIRSVTGVTETPTALIGAWQRLLGPGSTVITDDTLTVHTGGTPLLFVTPEHLSVMFPSTSADDFPPAPYMAAVTLQVDDVEATARVLADNGVVISRDRDGSVNVSPDQAHGVLLVFEP